MAYQLNEIFINTEHTIEYIFPGRIRMSEHDMNQTLKYVHEIEPFSLFYNLYT